MPYPVLRNRPVDVFLALLFGCAAAALAVAIGGSL